MGCMRGFFEICWETLLPIFKVANNDFKQENNKKSDEIKKFMGEPLNFVKKINIFGKIYGKKYSFLIF